MCDRLAKMNYILVKYRLLGIEQVLWKILVNLRAFSRFCDFDLKFSVSVIQ